MQKLMMTIPAVAIAFMLASCKSGEKPTPLQTKQTKPIVAKTEPIEATLDSVNRVVLFTESLDQTANEQKLCMRDLKTGETRELLHGIVWHPNRTPIPHLFSAVIRAKNDSADRLILIDEKGVKRGEVRHPNTNCSLMPQWSSDGKYFVFQMDRPDITAESPDYDPNGFSALAIVRYPSLKMKWFPLGKSGLYMKLAGFDNLLYVSDGLNENDSALIVDTYDLGGNKMSTKHEMHGTNFSANGRYYLPYLHEGCLPFEIYDAKTDKPLYAFPNDISTNGCHDYREWNPQDDDLLLIEYWSAQNPENFIEIYSVSKKRPIKRIKDKVYGWTADGKGLLVFRNMRFEIMPIQD
jgi:dipeptidyl aminopeptidase/acylaminoacyl peptidase